MRIGAQHSAYVKIAEGCDRPCSFCIIPKLRGPQRSRTIADIVAEVARARRERRPRGQPDRAGPHALRLGRRQLARRRAQTLAQLLRALGKVDGVDWIRLHYTFPSAFDDELIDAIASEPKVVKYIDVPLQHIADPMLKRMRRGHSSRVTRELVKTLRARIDDARPAHDVHRRPPRRDRGRVRRAVRVRRRVEVRSRRRVHVLDRAGHDVRDAAEPRRPRGRGASASRS